MPKKTLPVPGPGRDSLYDPSMNEAARKLALLGLTNDEMAAFFGVDVRTFQRWMAGEPAFCQAVNDGKVIADANVAESLYKRATGEHVQIEKVYTNKQTGDRQTIKVMTYIPGEAGAAMNWLKNRRRKDWQDKVDHNHEGTVTVVAKIVREVVKPNANDPNR